MPPVWQDGSVLPDMTRTVIRSCSILANQLDVRSNRFRSRKVQMCCEVLCLLYAINVHPDPVTDKFDPTRSRIRKNLPIGMNGCVS